MYFSKSMSKILFGRAVTDTDDAGIKKSEADFSNYTAQDFLKYWKSKAKERGITYIPAKYKDISVLKSLCKNFTSTEIKDMIDYIWDEKTKFYLSGQLLNPTSYGIFLLSNGFLNKVYNDTKLWKNGETLEEVRGWESNGDGGVEIEF